MTVNPGIQITLSHGDLQQIYDMALDKVKNTSNPVIDARLHPISCTITAFVDFVNKSGGCIQLTQPERLPYNSVDDE